MAFNDDETGVQTAQPRELYVFTGTYETWRLTSYPEDLTNSDGTYSAQYGVKRGDNEEGTQEDETSIEIELDASHPMVAAYAINEPPPDLQVEIYRAHPNDLDDSFLIFRGELMSWNIEGRTAKVKGPSLFSYYLDSPLPRPKYQAPCNHVLGDIMCQVDMTSADNSKATTITAINGTEITVAANDFPTDDELVAGQIIAPSERRRIVAVSGTTITIASAFSPGVAVSDAVTLRRGCDHALNGDCINRYNNAINFGGTPLVPRRSPFESRFE